MRKKEDSSDASSGTWGDGTLPGDGSFPAREALRKVVVCSVSLSQAQFELRLMRTPRTWVFRSIYAGSVAFPGIGQHGGLEMSSWIAGSEAPEGEREVRQSRTQRLSQRCWEWLGVVQSGKSR